LYNIIVETSVSYSLEHRQKFESISKVDSRRPFERPKKESECPPVSEQFNRHKSQRACVSKDVRTAKRTLPTESIHSMWCPDSNAMVGDSEVLMLASRCKRQSHPNACLEKHGLLLSLLGYFGDSWVSLYICCIVTQTD